MEQQAKPAKTPKAAAKKTKSTNRMPPVLSDDPLTRHTPVPVRYHFVSDIPQSYGHTYIRALPRDPERVFVYWEISATDIGALKQKHGAALNNARRILRVIDVTGLSYDGSNAPTFWDIEITAEADNWYISVPLAGRSYCIELGYLTEDGRFIMIVRSNSVHIPRGSVSEVIDEEWTELVSSDEEELLKIGSSERLMRRRKRTSEISSVSAEVMQRLVSGSGSGAFGSGSGAFGR